MMIRTFVKKPRVRATGAPAKSLYRKNMDAHLQVDDNSKRTNKQITIEAPTVISLCKTDKAASEALAQEAKGWMAARTQTKGEVYDIMGSETRPHPCVLTFTNKIYEYNKCQKNHSLCNNVNYFRALSNSIGGILFKNELAA